MRPSIRFIKENLKGELIGAEIGVDRGRHAQDILNNLNLKKLYLIDSWQPYIQENKKVVRTYKHYINVVKRFEKKLNVEILRKDSASASKSFPDNHFDFVYIDASHNYKDILIDLGTWYRKVKIGGIFCGHDYNYKWNGVTKAVNEFVKMHELILYSLALKKRAKNNFESDWWLFKKNIKEEIKN